MSPTAADLVTLLHQRGPVLTHLVAGPTDPATLTTEVSVSRAIYREMGAIRNTVTSLGLVAEICERLDDQDSALAHYETAVAIANETAFDVPHDSISEQRARLAAATSGDKED